MRAGKYSSPRDDASSRRTSAKRIGEPEVHALVVPLNSPRLHFIERLDVSGLQSPDAEVGPFNRNPLGSVFRSPD